MLEETSEKESRCNKKEKGAPPGHTNRTEEKALSLNVRENHESKTKKKEMRSGGLTPSREEDKDSTHQSSGKKTIPPLITDTKEGALSKGIPRLEEDKGSLKEGRARISGKKEAPSSASEGKNEFFKTMTERRQGAGVGKIT